ncbi:MAG: HD domain-containing protein [Treponema sp.]|nr:HD domain-containing protein [Treponema sp.]
MKKSILGIFNRLIAVVPPELQDQFDDIQLKNSIRRIRLLTVIALAAKFINVIFKYISNENLQADGLFSLFDYSELAVIALFNLSIFFFRRSSRKKLLWIFCYLLIASFFILYEFVINSAGTIEQIPFIFFVTIFLFSLLPDFKPQIFIPYAILYFIVTAYILMSKNQNINEYFGVQSHVLNIFLILLVTKILLYNSKVRTFVNTYQINRLNENLVLANKEIENKKEELRKYNKDLEKMVVIKTQRIVVLQKTVLETVAELVESRDDATGCHVARTSGYLKILIDAVVESGLYKSETFSWDIEQMVLSAQLHDVGKIAIDDSILRKPGKLSEEEFEKMKMHTVLGGDIIKNIQKKTEEQEFLDFAFIFAVYHHEKWDGSGYPEKRKGNDIPLAARIIAIIDVYDALISERPYKKAFSHDEAVNIIREGKGTHFDPDLTELFLSISDKFIKIN